MQLRKALTIFVILLLSSVISGRVHAQSHINIEGLLDPSPIANTYTQVGGWTVPHNHGTTSYTCATGTTNTYTITGTPALEVLDSVSPDYVRFHNATITANSTSVCGHIYFWARVLPDPSGNVDFDLSSYGQLKKGNSGASGSWVFISGWLQHYANGSLPGLADGVSGSWEHIGTTSGPPVSGPAHDKHGASTIVSFPPPAAVDENPDLSGIVNPRIMKGEIWFYLKKDQQLILSAGSGVQVTTAAGGGDGGIDLCNFFNCELLMDKVNQLRYEAVAERLERLEKHLNLPPLPQPKYEQLEGGKIPTEPLK